MTKNSINRDVLPICKPFESKSIQLICLGTNSLVSLDPILFLTQFRVHGGLKIEIWPKDKREIEA